MKTQKTKISILMAILLLISSGATAFAAQPNFADINEAPWAKEYINNMAEKKIISGYYDEATKKSTFKPNQPVSYIESVQMLYSTLKAASKLKTTTGLVKKHESLLKSNNIPQWSYEALAYAVEYNIISKDDLKTFMKNGKQAAAKREDVAIFIGKLLNMDELIDPLPILDFVDASSIKGISLPYVDLLVKKGIVTGDDQKKFNPTKPVTRAEMAVMCSKTYTLLATVSKPETPGKSEDTKVVATVRYVNANSNLIIVKNDGGEQGSYETIGITISKGSDKKTIFDIKEGDKVELTFTDNKLKSIEILESGKPAEPEKKYSYVIDYVDEKTKMLVVKDDKAKTLVYNLEDVLIYIDGKLKNIKDLREGYSANLIFDSDGDLIRVESDTSAHHEIEAFVEKMKKIDSDYYIMTVSESKNSITKREFIVDDDTEIRYRKSNTNLTISKIQEGQIVRIQFVGDRAFKVTIDEEEVEYAGILEERIEFKWEYPVLKLRDNNDRVLELEVDEDARIRRDSKRADLDELAKGDIVSVTLKNNKVTDIVATSRSKKSSVEGTIRQIVIGNPSKITIYDEDIREEVTYEILASADVEIDGKNADLRDLDLRYHVELRIENGVVTEIDAEKSAGKESLQGKIDRVYSKYNRLVVKHYDDKLEKYIKTSIEVTDDTTIISISGKTIRLGHLSEGTEVFVNGTMVDDIFEADKIIELK